ncbi:DddA-like double-stranded DNA deaminase toxin [Amycolatopsis sp. NPDC059657]|uniref:DddA-like double-stranded DNA deaminase toxin n=1 Tax=Amycolatopsis sp. NPDC059657 TaxID=3346899 RepID=UPI003672040F
MTGALDDLPVEQTRQQAGELTDEIVAVLQQALGGSDDRGVAHAMELLRLASAELNRAADLFIKARSHGASWISAANGQAGQRVNAPGAVTESEESKSPAWSSRRKTALPQWQRGSPTRGVWRDVDGGEHVVASGAEDDGLHAELADFLVRTGLVPPHMRRPEVAKHVELKVAFGMRRSESSRVELVVNKPVDTDLFGCDRLLPFVLKPGQTLVVHDPEGTKTYKGQQGD